MDGSIRFLEETDEVDILWFEEPFDEHQNGLERLRDWRRDHSSATLIADGEYQPNLQQVVRFAREGLIDVLLMDIASLGLTRWRALAHELRSSGVRLSPHAWGVPLKTYYTAQMAVGLGNVITVEGVRGDTVGVDTSAYTVRSGCLIVGDQPGFGMPVPSLPSAPPQSGP